MAENNHHHQPAIENIPGNPRLRRNRRPLRFRGDEPSYLLIIFAHIYTYTCSFIKHLIVRGRVSEVQRIIFLLYTLKYSLLKFFQVIELLCAFVCKMQGHLDTGQSIFCALVYFVFCLFVWCFIIPSSIFLFMIETCIIIKRRLQSVVTEIVN